MGTSQIGNKGEQVVVDYLVGLGYGILERQWRCPWGEIDLIAANPEWLLFVEVKTRSVKNWDEDGLLAISATKQKKIIITATNYLQRNPDRGLQSMRFDVALVRRNGVNYVLSSYLIGAFDVS